MILLILCDQLIQKSRRLKMKSYAKYMMLHKNIKIQAEQY